jgi:hypothetical protein
MGDRFRPPRWWWDADIDLSCWITASYDKDGNEPIRNGGTAVFGGGDPSIWLHFTVANSTLGLKTAEDFEILRLLAVNGGSRSLSTPPIQTLDVETFHTDPEEIHGFPGISNEVTACMAVDIHDEIDEGRTGELNNFCLFQCDVHVVH